MRNKEKAKDIATQRAMLLAPLLSDGLDNGMIKEIKERQDFPSEPYADT